MFSEESEYNKFMMIYNSSFFSLSKTKQENFRINNMDDLLEKSEIYFCENVLNLKQNTKEDVFDNLYTLNEKDQLRYNVFSNLIKGIGENKFELNEYLPEEDTILSYNTLYDYDFKNHVTQEEYRKQDSKDHVIKEYSIGIYAGWARGIVSVPQSLEDPKFHYCILNSLSSEIYFELKDIGHEHIEKLIPHKTESSIGNQNSKGLSPMTIKDNLKTKGKEKELKELKTRFYKLLVKFYEQMKIEIAQKKFNCVWVSDRSNEYKEKYDPSLSYVFSDAEVLKRIRLKHWQEDIETCFTDNFDIIDDLKIYYKNEFIKQLDLQYQDILDNFDPTVLKFEKKRKIFLSNQVIDKLDD
jgi:hypothetical protein